MKNLLFLIGLIGLVGCAPGSVFNKSGEPLKFGNKTIEDDKCESFAGGLFGFGNKWPLTVPKDVTAKDEKNLDEGRLKHGYYVVNEGKELVKADEKCKELTPTE